MTTNNAYDFPMLKKLEALQQKQPASLKGNTGLGKDTKALLTQFEKELSKFEISLFAHKPQTHFHK